MLASFCFRAMNNRLGVAAATVYLLAVFVVVRSQPVNGLNKPRALVSLLVDSWSAENYVAGAVALAKSALKHAPG